MEFSDSTRIKDLTINYKNHQDYEIGALNGMNFRRKDLLLIKIQILKK